MHHLYELARPGAHLWPPGAVDNLIDFVLNTKHVQILTPALSKLSRLVSTRYIYIICVLGVINVLVESPVMCHEHRSPKSKLKELCSKHYYSHLSGVAVQAIQISTKILCYW